MTSNGHAITIGGKLFITLQHKIAIIARHQAIKMGEGEIKWVLG